MASVVTGGLRLRFLLEEVIRSTRVRDLGTTPDTFGTLVEVSWQKNSERINVFS
jgi:hypothetical protein